MLKKIQYTKGDIFEAIIKQPTYQKEVIFLPHVVNRKGVWGAGFVVPLGMHFPKAKDSYLKWSKVLATSIPGGLFDLGNTQFVNVRHKLYICNMLCQKDIGIHRRQLDYIALAECMKKVWLKIQSKIDKGIKCCSIKAPMFGSGLAGGDWKFIECLIEDCWLANGIAVEIFHLTDLKD